VNYYQRHLGDYSKDTGFLTTYQHGVYALLLDWYYSNERPIPLDLAYRIVHARSGPERKATDEVLNTFFDVNKAPGFAHNKRADIDISKYRIKSERNSLIAKEGWDAKRMPDAVRNASQTLCEQDASHKPVTSSQEKAKATSSSGADQAGCPHNEILELYHSILPSNPRIKTWIGARQQNLRARWREEPKRQDLEYWGRFFAHVAASPFLTGRVMGSNGRPFSPGLDWLVKPENFAKVIEGRYHDKRDDA
jgi:uncharacterized protein YdaU (DUF1376 family)